MFLKMFGEFFPPCELYEINMSPLEWSNLALFAIVETGHIATDQEYYLNSKN